MMLNITKKMNLIRLVVLVLFILSFNSCQKKGSIISKVYKKDNAIEIFYGDFYTTKYGGLNYYIPNKKERELFFKINNIDSIVFFVDDNQYISKPLVFKPFSREKNNSDFSFFINEKQYKILIDTINTDLETMLIFSEKTDVEKLKDIGVIRATFIK